MTAERQRAGLDWGIALLSAVVLGLSLLSCVKPQQTTEPVTVWITLTLFGPLGSGEEQTTIPEDLATVLLPFDAPNCPGTVFFPDLAVESVDGQALGRLIEGWGSAKDQLKELSERNYEGFLGSIRKGFGQKANLATLKRAMAAELVSASIGARFAKLEAPTSQWSVPELERRYSDATCLFVLAGEDAAPVSGPGSRPSITIFHDAEALRDQLSERVCADFTSLRGEGVSLPCTILYHPGLSAKIDTGSGPPPPPPPNPNAIYAELAHRLEHSSPADRQELLEELIRAEVTFPTDYRFTYEKVKLAVYGVASHPEAFQWLGVAAEKAIRNGQAGQMLSQLRRDGESDENISKLARGHAESWDPILEALGSGNPASLRPLLAGASEHHH